MIWLCLVWTATTDAGVMYIYIVFSGKIGGGRHGHENNGEHGCV